LCGGGEAGLGGWLGGWWRWGFVGSWVPAVVLGWWCFPGWVGEGWGSRDGCGSVSDAVSAGAA